jgi:hypothetical protein
MTTTHMREHKIDAVDVERVRSRLNSRAVLVVFKRRFVGMATKEANGREHFKSINELTMKMIHQRGEK